MFSIKPKFTIKITLGACLAYSLCMAFLAIAAFSAAAGNVNCGTQADAQTAALSSPDPVNNISEEQSAESAKPIRKILFIGDSMTGWMAERLNAYGENNNFEVATIVWDGSTISKWATSQGLQKYIAEEKPDAIILSLGMNEMFERNPKTNLDAKTDKIINSFGDIPFLWIGPPSWPGHSEGEIFDSWMAQKLGPDRYFSSLKLSLPRQSANNPHPTRKGIEDWIEAVVEWIPENSCLQFESLDAPGKGKFSRGKTFIYKKMKEAL